MSAALEYDDRAWRRQVPAGVSPPGFAPPPVGRAVQGDTSFGANEKCAVGGSGRLGFYDKAIKLRKKAPQTRHEIPLDRMRIPPVLAAAKARFASASGLRPVRNY